MLSSNQQRDEVGLRWCCGAGGLLAWSASLVRLGSGLSLIILAGAEHCYLLAPLISSRMKSERDFSADSHSLSSRLIAESGRVTRSSDLPESFRRLRYAFILSPGVNGSFFGSVSVAVFFFFAIDVLQLPVCQSTVFQGRESAD